MTAVVAIPLPAPFVADRVELSRLIGAILIDTGLITLKYALVVVLEKPDANAWKFEPAVERQ